MVTSLLQWGTFYPMPCFFLDLPYFLQALCFAGQSRFGNEGSEARLSVEKNGLERRGAAGISSCHCLFLHFA